MSTLVNRIWPLRLRERSLYVLLLVGLKIGYAAAWAVAKAGRFIPKPRTRDLAIYLGNPLESDGHIRRFGVFGPLLDRDDVDWELFGLFEDTYVKRTLDGERSDQYILYLKNYWKRFFQVLKARHFKQILIQRNLFPDYPDKVVPHLERMARALCDDIAIDFWDPIYLWDPEVTYASLDHVDRLICDNSRLLAHFDGRFDPARSYTWPIAVDLDKYEVKQAYELHQPVRLFYTGSFWNVKDNLEPLMPILEKLHQEHPIELIVVGITAPSGSTVPVRHEPWSADTFFHLMAESDIGLFPIFDGEQNPERVAGKTLDYLATGLPFIGAPEGLPEGIDVGAHLLPVLDNTEADWLDGLTRLIEDADLRRRLGTEGRTFITQYCPVNAMYLRLREILAHPQVRSSR